MGDSGANEGGFTSTVFDGGLAEDQPAMDVAALARGDSLDRYFLIERVGAGGMGVVWSAYDPELDRKVALKLLRPRRAGGKEAQKRLLREAQAMAQLSHPNVTAIHAVGDYGGHIYLAMDLVEGKTLDRWVRSTQRSCEEIVAMFVQAGRGLAEAHRVGIVHRDFKPENVLIGGERARVTDFGLARGLAASVVDEPGQELQPTCDELGAEAGVLTRPLTRTGAMIGTPAYMAPEQFLSNRFDARSDQFSFCVALWEALYGQRPFGGTTLEELRTAVTLGRISKPEHDQRKVPAALELALRRGLSVEAKARWPSMNKLLAELERRPSSTWWRRALVAGGALVGSFGLAYVATPLFAAQEREVKVGQSCAHSQEKLWTTAQAAALDGQLSRVVLEPRVSALLLAELQDYARRWESLQAQLCELDASELGPRLRCLESRRAAFEVRAQLLADAGAPAASSLLAGLPDLDACERPEYLAQLPASLDSDGARGSWRELEQVRAWRELGRGDLARAGSERLEAATRGQASVLRARVLVELGAALVEQGELSAGREQLEAGFALALREADARACVSAASRFAGLEQGRAALAWVGRGRACQARLGVSMLEQAQLTLHEAQAYAGLGELQAARERLEGLLAGFGVGQDLAKLAALRPVQAWITLDALQQLAALSQRTGRAARALAQLELAQQFAVVRLGPAHPRSEHIALVLLEQYRRAGSWAEAEGLASELLQGGERSSRVGARVQRVLLQLTRVQLAPPPAREGALARLERELAQLGGELEQLEPGPRAWEARVQLHLASAAAQRLRGEPEQARAQLVAVEHLLDEVSTDAGSAHALALGLERAHASLAAGQLEQARSEFGLVVDAAQGLGPHAELTAARAAQARALAGSGALSESERVAELDEVLVRWAALSGAGDHLESLAGLEALAALDPARASELSARADAIRARLLAADVAL